MLGNTPSGWRNSRMPDQTITFAVGDREIRVEYQALRDDRFRLRDGRHATVHACDADAIDVEIGGRRSRSRITRGGDRLLVHSPSGDVMLTLQPRFQLPGAEDTDDGFVAPMPGRVTELRVGVGDAVRAGDTLVVLEAMKMEHPMSATEDGVVSEVRVAVGEQVESGTVLLVVDPANDGKGDST